MGESRPKKNRISGCSLTWARGAKNEFRFGSFFLFFFTLPYEERIWFLFLLLLLLLRKPTKKQNKRKNGARWNLARGNQVMRFYKKDIPINDCRPKISMIMKRNHGRINEKLGGNRKPSKKPVKPNKTQ